MSNTENKDQDTQPTEKKKISLQEAMKQMLANKNQGKSMSNAKSNPINNSSRQSQVTKKPNNQRRKMGSS